MQASSTAMIKKAIIILVVLLVICFIVYGLKKSHDSTQDAVVIQGRMDMQSTAIAAKVPGRISKIFVTEGDKVTVGEQLIEMDSPEITAKIDQAKAGKAMAQSQLDKAQSGARPQEVGQAKAAWQAQQAAATLAKSTYERINRLYNEGLMARQKRDEAYTQYIANQDKADAARLQYDLAMEGARLEDKQAAQAQVEKVDAMLAEAEVAQNEANLKSPVAGIVDDVIVKVGEVVGQGVPLMTVVHPDDQWAVLNITENHLNQFQIGSTFKAQIPALSKPDSPYYKEFKVYASSSMSDFATWRATNSDDGFDVRTFEVKARPLQPDSHIRAGMSVIVTLDPSIAND